MSNKTIAVVVGVGLTLGLGWVLFHKKPTEAPAPSGDDLTAPPPEFPSEPIGPAEPIED